MAFSMKGRFWDYFMTGVNLAGAAAFILLVHVIALVSHAPVLFVIVVDGVVIAAVGYDIFNIWKPKKAPKDES